MFKSLSKEVILKGIAFVFCIGWLIVIHNFNFGPVDAGDGLMHFNIAQASWTKPILFLDHWGKPFFILLSSTFAQFGLGGVVYLNILIFAITVIFAWKILKHFSIPYGIQCLFPFILITLFDYSSTVLAGLTEPLFSMFFMIATWLLVKKRWMWFAIVISFLPFMRSEGQLPIILAFIVLVFLKKFKHLPFLFLGFILYATIGYFAFGDFWWYFNNSPYRLDNDIYGVGSWDTYFISYKMYLGNLGLFIFIFAACRIVYLLKIKKWEELQFPWLFMTYGVFLGIIILHSYFWANGLNGSLGLTRIATQAMPSFVLINLYYLGRINYLPFAKVILRAVIVLLILLKTVECIRPKYFPMKSAGLDLQVIRAADYLLPFKNSKRHFFFHHLLFPLRMNENPMKENQKCVFHYNLDLKSDLGTKIKPGDFLIRDSHFGPQEMGLPLSQLAECPEMVKVKEFVSDFQTEDRYNEVEGVVVYQYQPQKR
jgi:hypothetical protein